VATTTAVTAITTGTVTTAVTPWPCIGETFPSTATTEPA
jgi:hypothetical protein